MQTSMVICALALAASVVNGQNEGCGLAVLDKCYRGFPLNGSTPDILVETVGEIPSVEECQWFCKELFGGECTWFAFDTQTGQCNIFKGSITDYTSSCELVGYTKEPNVADCSTTLAGDDACYNFREGYCRFEDYVILENLQFVQLLEHCQEACRHRPDCEFFLYEEKDKVCHLEGSQTRTCDVVHGLPDPPFGDCLSANKIPFTVSTSGSLNATSAVSATTVGIPTTTSGECCTNVLVSGISGYYSNLNGLYVFQSQIAGHAYQADSWWKKHDDTDVFDRKIWWAHWSEWIIENGNYVWHKTCSTECPNQCDRSWYDGKKQLIDTNIKVECTGGVFM